MDRLWAPWRMTYISGINSTGPAAGGCFLCAARDATDDAAAHVFIRHPKAFAVLNLFPYNNGHTLVVPGAHKGNLAELADDEMLAIMTVTRDVMDAMQRTMRPDGFNVGFNFGRSAGAASPNTCIATSCPAGTATRTSCPSSATRR